jgi:hypothetical protein
MAHDSTKNRQKDAECASEVLAPRRWHRLAKGVPQHGAAHSAHETEGCGWQFTNTMCAGGKRESRRCLGRKIRHSLRLEIKETHSVDG